MEVQLSTDQTARTKTQTLSLRLDPKTRFILDFMSRIKGQTITVVVERAIKEAAEKATIAVESDNPRESPDIYSWEYFWDTDDGVRTLKLLSNSAYTTTYDEDEIRRFTLDHWAFFYTDKHGDAPRRPFVAILWPNMNRYLGIWRTEKANDFWAASKAMTEDLNKAQIEPPEWPIQKKKMSANVPSFAREDMDDEVPF